ncbi:hypothetical protein AVDCRST_MAG84-4994 [uncultured Microcoleus sp.]|uniref:Uncharacterized protein n=1 Tax=uncultured Microcoleus sp. TaxID=259945 RepID=A0A6J4NB73_9CYAN|nr:hypothetical protein AVDCRST_MAG84-4994 [uncultured Microcoleus sp.]
MAAGVKDFSLALRHSPVSQIKVSGCVFALMLQPKKNLAEASLTLDNSYSIRNLCFVHELQQTTTNFCGWGSLGSRFSPNLHQILKDRYSIKCFTCSAYSRLSHSRKIYKNLQKFSIFCGLPNG